MILAKPRIGERASRSASELRTASLNQVKATKLPDKPKSRIGGEAMGKGTQRAFRGERRQRVRRDQSRNLGDPMSSWRD